MTDLKTNNGKHKASTLAKLIIPHIVDKKQLNDYKIISKKYDSGNSQLRILDPGSYKKIKAIYGYFAESLLRHKFASKFNIEPHDYSMKLVTEKFASDILPINKISKSENIIFSSDATKKIVEEIVRKIFDEKKSILDKEDIIKLCTESITSNYKEYKSKKHEIDYNINAIINSSKKSDILEHIDDLKKFIIFQIECLQNYGLQLCKVALSRQGVYNEINRINKFRSYDLTLRKYYIELYNKYRHTKNTETIIHDILELSILHDISNSGFNGKLQAYTHILKYIKIRNKKQLKLLDKELTNYANIKSKDRKNIMLCPRLDYKNIYGVADLIIDDELIDVKTSEHSYNPNILTIGDEQVNTKEFGLESDQNIASNDDFHQLLLYAIMYYNNRKSGKSFRYDNYNNMPPKINKITIYNPLHSSELSVDISKFDYDAALLSLDKIIIGKAPKNSNYIPINCGNCKSIFWIDSKKNSELFDKYIKKIKSEYVNKLNCEKCQPKNNDIKFIYKQYGSWNVSHVSGKCKNCYNSVWIDVNNSIIIKHDKSKYKSYRDEPDCHNVWDYDGFYINRNYKKHLECLNCNPNDKYNIYEYNEEKYRWELIKQGKKCSTCDIVIWKYKYEKWNDIVNCKNHDPSTEYKKYVYNNTGWGLDLEGKKCTSCDEILWKSKNDQWADIVNCINHNPSNKYEKYDYYKFGWSLISRGKDCEICKINLIYIPVKNTGSIEIIRCNNCNPSDNNIEYKWEDYKWIKYRERDGYLCFYCRIPLWKYTNLPTQYFEINRNFEKSCCMECYTKYKANRNQISKIDLLAIEYFEKKYSDYRITDIKDNYIYEKNCIKCGNVYKLLNNLFELCNKCCPDSTEFIYSWNNIIGWFKSYEIKKCANCDMRIDNLVGSTKYKIGYCEKCHPKDNDFEYKWNEIKGWEKICEIKKCNKCQVEILKKPIELYWHSILQCSKCKPDKSNVIFDDYGWKSILPMPSEIKRKFPDENKLFKSLLNTTGYSKRDFEEYEKIIASEDFQSWKRGKNIENKSKNSILIGGKLHKDICKRRFKKDALYFDEMEKNIKNKDKLIKEYETKNAHIIKENEDIKRYNETIAKQYKEEALKIIEKIKSLGWDEWYEFENILYGVPMICDNIHRENNCGGIIDENMVYFVCKKCNKYTLK